MIVGTRGSKLSLIQTASIIQAIKKHEPLIEVETKIIQTTGDKLESAPLQEIAGKGVFEKEIDEAIISGEVDFSVHSMKDIPAEQPKGLTIAAVPARAPANDVFISRISSRLGELPRGASVGTSSPRRKAELLRARPDLSILPIRGNVDTRIRKLDAGNYDAVVLAEAGVIRLGMQSRIVERLPVQDFTPAPGQGFLAVVARHDREDLLKILRYANDPNSWVEATTERAFMNEVGGGCKIPLGAFAEAKGGTIRLMGSVISPEGTKRINVNEEGDLESPEKTGRVAAQRLLRMGAIEIIESWKNS